MKYRISNITATFLILGTFITELFQALTNFIGIGFVLNPIISVFIWLSVYFILTTHNVSTFGARKLTAAFISTVIEVIPFVAAIPAWTLYVISMVVMSRSEDRSKRPSNE